MGDAQTTVELGDLIVATFDEAALHCADPREVSSSAVQVILRILHRAPNRSPAASMEGGDTELRVDSRWRNPRSILVPSGAWAGLKLRDEVFLGVQGLQGRDACSISQRDTREDLGRWDNEGGCTYASPSAAHWPSVAPPRGRLP